MSAKTVIKILDEVFQNREYDLSLLSLKEFKDLSNRLTVFASEYEAPPRIPGKSRFYAGGTAWNTTQIPTGKILFGLAGLQYGADVAIAQTLCLMHDSVVCHDPITDMIGAHETDFLPRFFPNIYEGEILSGSNIYGTKLLTKELIEDAAVRLNPTLNVYNKARELIERGYLIPVPTRVLLNQKAPSIITQLRHSAKDPKMLQISTESQTIPTNDETINVFMQPNGDSKIKIGPASNNPNLRLHYGLMHHLKCLLVAYKTSADYAPFDDFGWKILAYKHDQLGEILNKTSFIKLSRTIATSTLAIPIVRGFEIQDIVSIRRDEEIFDELRNILRQTVKPELVSSDLKEFYKDYEAQVLDAIKLWHRAIASSPRKRDLFRNISTIGSSTLIVTDAILFSSSDPVSKIIQAVAGLPGIYYGIKDLLICGQNPRHRLFKVLKRYSSPKNNI